MKTKLVTYYVGNVAFVPSGGNIGNVELWIRTDAAVFVACPTCDALPGAMCTSPKTGKRTAQTHYNRRVKYRQLNP